MAISVIGSAAASLVVISVIEDYSRVNKIGGMQEDDLILGFRTGVGATRMANDAVPIGFSYLQPTIRSSGVYYNTAGNMRKNIFYKRVTSSDLSGPSYWEWPFEFEWNNEACAIICLRGVDWVHGPFGQIAGPTTWPIARGAGAGGSLTAAMPEVLPGGYQQSTEQPFTIGLAAYQLELLSGTISAAFSNMTTEISTPVSTYGCSIGYKQSTDYIDQTTNNASITAVSSANRRIDKVYSIAILPEPSSDIGPIKRVISYTGGSVGIPFSTSASITIDARGANGGFNQSAITSRGAYGSRVQCEYYLGIPQTLYAYVGGSPLDGVFVTTGSLASDWFNETSLPGFNGGGWGGYTTTSETSAGGGGGGGTDLRIGPNLADRIVVAGGGGGAGGNNTTIPNETGFAGFPNGGTGRVGTGPQTGGTGGTQLVGGTGGAGALAGTNGALGQGGSSGAGTVLRGGGGGGGGFYGGGGGGAPTTAQVAAGGGGGSSKTTGIASTETNDFNSQNGLLILEWDIPPTFNTKAVSIIPSGLAPPPLLESSFTKLMTSLFAVPQTLLSQFINVSPFQSAGLLQEIGSNAASLTFTASGILSANDNLLMSWPFDLDNGYSLDKTALLELFARGILINMPPAVASGQVIKIIRPVLPEPRSITKGRPRDGY